MLFKDFSQNINPHQAYRYKKVKTPARNMLKAYEEWKSIALKIDEESGAQEWKLDNSSPYFDAEIISHRLGYVKTLPHSNNVPNDLMYILREGLSYDIANIAHPLLFTEAYVGTKKNY